jgi:NAD-dependent dihydropyrimidine dehydrogenase PreA subunit
MLWLPAYKMPQKEVAAPKQIMNVPENPSPEVDPELCDGCGLCVRVCPTHALTIINQKAAVTQPHACEYHGYCERVCPVQAISRPFQIILSQK